MFSLIEDSLIIITCVAMTFIILLKVGPHYAHQLFVFYAKRRKINGCLELRSTMQTRILMDREFEKAKKLGTLTDEELAHGCIKEHYALKYNLEEGRYLIKRGALKEIENVNRLTRH